MGRSPSSARISKSKSKSRKSESDSDSRSRSASPDSPKPKRNKRIEKKRSVRKRRSPTPHPGAKNKSKSKIVVNRSRSLLEKIQKSNPAPKAKVEESPSDDNSSDDENAADTSLGHNNNSSLPNLNNGQPSSTVVNAKVISNDTNNGNPSGTEPPAASGPPEVLTPPFCSPRDNNRYRVLRLSNGFKAVLISTCAYGLEQARKDIKKLKSDGKCSQAPLPATTIFERTRGRTESETELEEKEREKLKAKAKRKNIPILDCSNDDGLVEKFDKLIIESGDDSILNNVWNGGKWLKNLTKTAAEIEEEKEELEFLNKTDEMIDEELMKLACHITATSDMRGASVALTIGCGTMNDPPQFQGIAQLSTNVVADLLSEKGFWYYRENLNEETTTLQCSYTSPNVKENLLALGRVLNDLHVGKFTELVDEIDWMDYVQEIYQCSFCWDSPMSDPRRLNLIYSLSKPDHVIRSSSVGGNPLQLWTLTGTDNVDVTAVTKKIEEFLQCHYIPNNMTLAVQAPMSLDHLQELVQNSFSKLKTKPKVELTADPAPFNTPEFKRFYYVQCTNPFCCDDGDAYLVITWAVPSIYCRDYLTKPLDYIVSLILDESEHGLCYTLRQENLISTINCSVLKNKFFGLLQIEVELHEDGLKNIDRTISFIISYLKYLRSVGASLSSFNDQQKRYSNIFHALGQTVSLRNPYSISASNLSVWLQSYKSEELLIGPLLTRRYEPDLINECLGYLTPEDANYMLFTCPDDSIMDEPMEYEYEPIYKTKYFSTEIPAGKYSFWSSASSLLNPAFKLPRPSEFFDRRMCLVRATSDQIYFLDNGIYKPYKIWYQQNIAMKNYFSTYMVHIISTIACNGPQQVCLRRIWVMMLIDKLNARLYSAELADIGTYVKSTQYGILIYISSWNRQITRALELILETIMTFEIEITDARKNIFNKKQIELLKHFAALMKNPYLSNWYAECNIYEVITNMDRWLIPELHTELKKLRYSHFQTFVNDFKTNCTVAGFLHGNIERDDAVHLAELIEKHIHPKINIDRFRIRKYQLPVGERIVRFTSLSHTSQTNHVANYYQIGYTTVKMRVMSQMVYMALFRHLFAKSFKFIFEDRKFFFMFPSLMESQGIVTLVVSSYGEPKLTLDDMNDYIEDALESFYTDKLCNMQPSEFKELKKVTSEGIGLYGLLSKADFELYEEYFSIQDLTFRFTEHYCKMDKLEALTLKELQCWFKDHTTDEGCNKRKLSIQIYPIKEKQKQLVESSSDSAVETSTPLPPPTTMAEWRTRRKQLRTCTVDHPHKTIHKHKPFQNESFQLYLDPKVPGKCDNEHFITNIELFKRSLFGFPYRASED